MILGADYASVDGNAPPNWGAAKAAGLRFVVVRGSWGTVLDPVLKRDRAAIRAAGLVFGAYMFLRYVPHGPTPEVQVDAFTDTLGRLELNDLPPSLDIEFPGHGIVDTGMAPPEALDWTRRAWQRLKETYGVPPLDYTSARVWHEDLHDQDPGAMRDSPLWLARYPYASDVQAQLAPSLTDPPVPQVWGDADDSWIHQYQGDALHMPGFTATVDLNRFRPLMKGARGDRVRWVQHRLGREETGFFDGALDAAIRVMQMESGLVVDGVIGPATFALICWHEGPESPHG